MNYLILKVWTQTSSFRNPDFQNFHKSYLLPPPTALIGFAGAALGFSPKKSQDFFNNNEIKFGIYGKSEGFASDLWKYNSFKDSKSITKGIITREIHFINQYLIVYASENADLINQLKTAFLYPKYTLTLGTSDSLAKIKLIDSYREAESYEVENCLLEGNIISEVLLNIDKDISFKIYSTNEPLSYDLPTEFSYESDYGIRRIVARKTFSFVPKKMKLNIPKNGIEVEEKFIPIFSIH